MPPGAGSSRIHPLLTTDELLIKDLHRSQAGNAGKTGALSIHLQLPGTGTTGALSGTTGKNLEASEEREEKFGKRGERVPSREGDGAAPLLNMK